MPSAPYHNFSDLRKFRKALPMVFVTRPGIAVTSGSKMVLRTCCITLCQLHDKRKKSKDFNTRKRTEDKKFHIECNGDYGEALTKVNIMNISALCQGEDAQKW